MRISHYCTLTLLIAFAGATVLQAQSANPMSSELKQMYTGVKNNLIRAAEKMPEENYSFKPVPEIRSFGQLVAHVADSVARTCSTVNGESKSVNAASKTTKADIVAALKDGFAMCDTAYDSLTDASAAQMIKLGRGERTRMGALTGNLSHANEEYGYMAVYLRLKGVVPPSSEGR
jgi:hypothetical protein